MIVFNLKSWQVSAFLISHLTVHEVDINPVPSSIHLSCFNFLTLCELQELILWL